MPKKINKSDKKELGGKWNNKLKLWYIDNDDIELNIILKKYQMIHIMYD